MKKIIVNEAMYNEVQGGRFYLETESLAPMYIVINEWSGEPVFKSFDKADAETYLSRMKDGEDHSVVRYTNAEKARKALVKFIGAYKSAMAEYETANVLMDTSGYSADDYGLEIRLTKDGMCHIDSSYGNGASFSESYDLYDKKSADEFMEQIKQYGSDLKKGLKYFKDFSTDEEGDDENYDERFSAGFD